MNNLAVRSLFALLAAPFFVFLLWFAPWTRWSIMLILAGGGAWEWSRMVAARVPGRAPLVLAPLAACIWVLAWVGEVNQPGLPLLVAPILLGAYIIVAFHRVDVQDIFPWLAMHFAAPLYLGLWGGLMVGLMGTDFITSLPFLLVALSMWFCDTFAYFTGRLFGRRKLAPTISPKKTWEGAVGGTLATMILVYFVGPYWMGVSGYATLLLALLLSVAGQFGDLLMSALKRYCGAKDSSQIFPGHGGVLDRFDSLFLAGPMVVIVLPWLRTLG